MAQVCQKLVFHDDEKVARESVEMWVDLFAEGSLCDLETDVLKFMYTVLDTFKLPLTVRYQTTEYFKMYVKAYPNKLITEGLLQPIMKTCINMLMMQPTDDDDEDEVGGNMDMAIEILDNLFLNIRVDQTSTLALKGVQQLIENGNMRAALALLAIMTEGCAEFFFEDASILPQLFSIIMKGLNDEDKKTRKTAYETLTQFVYHLSAEMNKHAAEIMPAIFQGLQREIADKPVLEAVCCTLDAYCSALEKGIEPFVNTIVETLMNLLPNSSSTDVQEAVISALSSTICTARENKISVPHIEKLVEMLLNVIQGCNDKDVLRLRGEATNCLGEICLAIGKETTSQLNKQTDFINKIIHGANNFNDPTLKEFSYGFFANLGRIYGEELAETPQFDQMFNMAIESLENEDGLVKHVEEDGFGLGNPQNMPGDLPENTEEDDELYKFYFTTGFTEEKCAACQALEKFAMFCGAKMATKWDSAFQCVIDTMAYPHPTMKSYAIVAYHQLCMNVIKTIRSNGCSDQNLIITGIQYVQMAMPLYMVALVREDDKDCAAQCLIAIAELLKTDLHLVLGLADNVPNDSVLNVLAKMGNIQNQTNIEEFMETMSMLFDEECQFQSPDDDKDIKKRETEENIILDGLTDIIQALTQTFNSSQLAAFWKEIFPKLEKFLQPNRSLIEHSLAIGTMGDVSGFLTGNDIEPFLNASMQMAFQGLETGKNHLVLQNSVFALGCLCRSGGARCEQYLEKMLNFLGPMVQMPRKAPKKFDRLIRDNAYSALGSLLANVPLKDDLFYKLFEGFLAGLPLEEDYSENEWVLKAILKILEQKQNVVGKYLQQITNVLNQSLTLPQIPDEISAQVKGVLQRIGTSI